MFCNHCGYDMGDAQVCPKCGTPAKNIQQPEQPWQPSQTVPPPQYGQPASPPPPQYGQYGQPGQTVPPPQYGPVGQQVPPPQYGPTGQHGQPGQPYGAPPKKKSVATKWWFWLLIVLAIVIIIVVSIFLNRGNNNKGGASDNPQPGTSTTQDAIDNGGGNAATPPADSGNTAPAPPDGTGDWTTVTSKEMTYKVSKDWNKVKAGDITYYYFNNEGVAPYLTEQPIAQSGLTNDKFILDSFVNGIKSTSSDGNISSQTLKNRNGIEGMQFKYKMDAGGMTFDAVGFVFVYNEVVYSFILAYDEGKGTANQDITDYLFDNIALVSGDPVPMTDTLG